MKKTILLICVLASILVISACGKKKEATPVVNNPEPSITENAPVASNEEKELVFNEALTPIKEHQDEIKPDIERALQKLYKNSWGDDIEDSKFTVTKMYKVEDEQNNETLKEMELTEDKMAFDVIFDIKLADGVNPEPHTRSGGTFDEATRWVKNMKGAGIFKYNEHEIRIDDFRVEF